MNHRTDDPAGPNEGHGTRPTEDPDGGHPDEVTHEVEETDLRNIVHGPEDAEQADAESGTGNGPGEDPVESAGPTAEGGGPAGPPATPARPAGRLTSAVAWLACLLALGALAGVAWLGWQGRDSGDTSAANARAIEALSEELTGRLAETRDEVEALEDRLVELGEAGTGYADELASIERQVNELARQDESILPRLARLEDAISSLQGISAGVRETWMLAEAEYYLQVANAELQLANNPEVALLALEYADERVRQLADPGLTGVRRALSREIQALEGYERADVEGVTLALANLAERVDALPLDEQVVESPAAEEPLDPEAEGLSRAWASVKEAFSDLVSVRRADEAVQPLMSPDAAHFLRANLALQFQAARLAFLRGEQAVFRESLQNAADWLERYYDADSRAVQSALDTIEETRDARLQGSPPDISESLRLLRQYQSQREMNTAGRAGEEPAQ